MRTRIGRQTAPRRLRAVLRASCVALAGLAATGCDGETARSAVQSEKAGPPRLERVAHEARVPAQPAAPAAATPVAPDAAPKPPRLAAELHAPTQFAEVEPVPPLPAEPAVQATLALPDSASPHRSDGDAGELRIAVLDDAASIPVAAPLELRLVPIALGGDTLMAGPALAEVEPEPRVEALVAAARAPLPAALPGPAPAFLPDEPAALAVAPAAVSPAPLPAPAPGEPTAPAPALAAVSPAPAPAPDKRVHVAQVSDTARTAYIAQIGIEASGRRLAVRAGDDVLGAVQFQVADGRVSVHVGQVLDLFEGRMDTARFAALRGSPAAREFVSLDQVRKAGIPLEYDAVYDELVLGPNSG